MSTAQLALISSRQSNRRSIFGRSDSTQSTSNAAGRHQHRLTVMLISVVVVFLVCQLPQAILKLYTVYLQNTDSMTSIRQLRVTIAANYCNLLVMINSSVNFILYSSFSTKFRQSFRDLFICRTCNVVCCFCRNYQNGGFQPPARLPTRSEWSRQSFTKRTA
jgi:7 transmembrane receptor (rhodopsin family)